MGPLVIHSVFDALAWTAAAAMAFWLTRNARIDFPVGEAQRGSYYAALVVGSASGAYIFGTLNLVVSGIPGIGRSIEGAIFGAVLAVETYKAVAGLRLRTGARFAAPLCVGVVIGRFGCYFSGMDDFTYGTPAAWPWCHDFGDGVLRHPVPLYESASMALFLALYLFAVLRDNRTIIENGLYIAIGWYAAQRFVWEFFKPYASVLGPLSVFQILSIVLLLYALFMLLTADGKSHERALHA